MKHVSRIVLTVIGGVGYDSLFGISESKTVKTPYGSVSLSIFSFDSFDIVFISRHQGVNHVPPHKVNYSALISAAKEIGAPVLSINSVGLMRPIPLTENYETESEFKSKTHVESDSLFDFPLFVPNDFIDMTQNRVCTFYDQETVHTDMSDPYCIDLRNQLFSVLKERRLSYSEGIYLCTEGPRFETKAEIMMYSQFADTVGMTGVPEVVLAKEAGLCYASLCVLTNPAAGVDSGRDIVTADEVKVCAGQNQKMIFAVISDLAENLNKTDAETDAGKRCRCKNAIAHGKL